MKKTLVVLDGHVVDEIFEGVDETQFRLLGVDPSDEYIGMSSLEWDGLRQACLAIGLVPNVRVGGAGANTARWFARLGGSSHVHGQVGIDEQGDQVLDQLAFDGCVSFVRTVHRPTGRCLVFVRPDGHRVMRSDVGGSMEFDDYATVVRSLHSGAWLHLTGYLLDDRTPIHRVAWEAMRMAMKGGVPISVDIGSGAHLGREIIQCVVEQHANVMFLNENETKMLGFSTVEKAVDSLLSWTHKDRHAIVIVTLGARGAFVGRGKIRRHIPAERVHVRDTTGAGDAFAAGFLSGHLRGKALGVSVRLGCVVAAETVRVLGGVPSHSVS